MGEWGEGEVGAKDRAIRSVDTERVLMYWQIGKVILEEEQEGKERAGYGEFLLKIKSFTYHILLRKK